MVNKSHLAVLISLMTVLAGTAAEATPAVTTYDELLSAIRKVKALSRERVEALVEAEKVREAWEIGRLINTHVLQNKPRASYDKQVVIRLAKDLESSPTEILYMLRFARAYPIQPQAAELSWSHYRELLSLNDSQEREEVATQAVREHWGRDRVREEVRKRQELEKYETEEKHLAKEITEEILTATPGKPGTYRVVKAYYGKQPDQLVLDLGFSNYHQPAGEFPFKEGDIVKVGAGSHARPNGQTTGAHRGAPLQLLFNTTEDDLYTYSAHIIRVIDGDTFTAAVDLGFGFTTVQTLRLRALDAPEIESAAGREAKEFLEKTLPVGSDILVRTSRSDKYDRYLADVFGPLRSVKTSSGRTQTTGDEYAEGEYVNQKLVERGLAERL